jgi:microcystin-dependent protein
MNKIEVLGGGFPGTSKTWRFIRDMINEVHDVAVALGGDNCIVKGCEVVNGVAADGIVIINGESYPFQGGDVGVNVEIVEAVEQVTYFTDADIDGQADLLDAYFERYARFAAAGTPWADLKRITPLSEVARRLPPLQTALPFWGAIADIKDGWQLCDGSNGTPDLSGMFVVGYDPNDAAHDEPGKTGGESKHALSIAEMPAHNFSGSVNIPGHKHSLPKPVPGKGGNTDQNGLTVKDDNINSVDITETSTSAAQVVNYTTGMKGSNTPHENRPKFYTMAWIGYVG